MFDRMRSQLPTRRVSGMVGAMVTAVMEKGTPKRAYFETRILLSILYRNPKELPSVLLGKARKVQDAIASEFKSTAHSYASNDEGPIVPVFTNDELEQLSGSQLLVARDGTVQLPIVMLDSPQTPPATTGNHAKMSARPRRLFLDISVVYEKDHNTGIQRVVREMNAALQAVNTYGTQALSALPFTRTRDTFKVPKKWLIDEDAVPFAPVALRAGDDLLMIDASWAEHQKFGALFDAVRSHDGRIYSVVYDLVPILHPEFCSEEMPDIFKDWLLHAIRESDGIVCISRTVADELMAYIAENELPHRQGLKIGWWHLGTNLVESGGTVRKSVRDAFETDVPVFLMVGTIEPRKRHQVVLEAMEMLWEQGVEARLVMLGKRGWRMDDFTARLLGNSRFDKQLFWFDGVSDAEISHAYGHSTALIFASIYEGYGLPVIEAAQAGLPVVCSDIPILREVAGDSAAYFDVDDPASLRETLERIVSGEPLPEPAGMTANTWAESSTMLLDVIYGDNWYATLP